jgi:hypothetical protein
MQGSGTVELGQNGEHASVSFDVKWAGDSAFTVQFSTFLGMTVASVNADGPGKWTVTAADSHWTVSPDIDISVGQEFMSFPVSWKEFVSVLTGRLLCESMFSREPDSQYVDNRSISFLWKSQSCGNHLVDIYVKIDNKKKRLSEISYKDASKGIKVDRSLGGQMSVWSLTMSDFSSGHAKEFKFVQSNNNYFYVTYRSMKFHSSAVKRKQS